MQLKPLRTEKSLKLASIGRYVFVVDKQANKTEIKQAVEKTFKVNAIKVQTINIPGKKYRTGKKGLKGKRPDGKKAIVTVKSGQKIDLFEAA